MPQRNVLTGHHIVYVEALLCRANLHQQERQGIGAPVDHLDVAIEFDPSVIGKPVLVKQQRPLCGALVGQSAPEFYRARWDVVANWDRIHTLAIVSSTFSIPAARACRSVGVE